MKIFNRILMILIVPLILIGGINYLVDPDYTLRKDYIPKLAESLTDGKLISGPVNINSRVLKRQWIKRLPSSPEVLVLGSSRILSLSKEAFPNKVFFNASVTNCTFQDMYAFLNLVEEKSDKLPETIIICADQWLFGDSFSEKRWLNNRTDFVEMLRKTGDISQNKFPSKWVLNKEWIKEFFSVQYLIRSLKGLKKTDEFVICDSIRSNKMMSLPDGSRSLPLKIVNMVEIEVNKKAVDYFYSSTDEQFQKLSQLQCQLFENLIGYLESKKCEVIVFIPPYHPETFQLLKQSDNTTGIFKLEDYLLTFSENHRVKIIGSTNPVKLNLTKFDFYDGVHLKPTVLNDLFFILSN